MASVKVPCANEAMLEMGLMTSNGDRKPRFSPVHVVTVVLLLAILLCAIWTAWNVSMLASNSQRDSQQSQADKNGTLVSDNNCADCHFRLKRDVANPPTVNVSGIARFSVSLPQKDTTDGQWKMVTSGQSTAHVQVPNQFMYYGKKILHWSESELADRSAFELVSCSGAIRIQKSGLYQIKAHVTLVTTRNLEAVSILVQRNESDEARPLATTQLTTLAKVGPLIEHSAGYYQVFDPEAYAFLEAGAEITVQTLTQMHPRTAVLIAPAASHLVLRRL